MLTTVPTQRPSPAEGAFPAERGLGARQSGLRRGYIQMQHGFVLFIGHFCTTVHQRTHVRILRLARVDKWVSFMAAYAREWVCFGTAHVSVAGELAVQVCAMAGEAIVKAVRSQTLEVRTGTGAAQLVVWVGAVTRELSVQVGHVAGERVFQVHAVGAVQVGAVHAAVHAGGGHVIRIVPEAGPRSVEGTSLRPVLQAALQGKGWPGQFIREGLRASRAPD